MAAGSALFAYGVAALVRGLRLSDWDRSKPIAAVGGGRIGVIGIALLGLGAAWLWQQLWLLVLALAFGGEELLESSVILYVLRRGQRIERAA